MTKVELGDGLLERAAELALLESRLAAAISGEGGTVLVEAPAGTGKSSLLRVMRDAARGAGVRVLHARGGEVEHTLVFGVLRQAFARAAAGAGLVDAGPVAPAIRALGLSASETPADRAVVAQAFAWLVSELADAAPLLLVVDDAHWADADSLAVLEHLSVRLDDVPVLLALGARPSEVPALLRIGADPGVIPVRPGPLSPAAVSALVGEQLGVAPDPAFAAACHQITGGNPLLVRECVRDPALAAAASASDGAQLLRGLAPRALARLVLARLAPLGSESVMLARAVALFPGGAEVRHVAALAGLDVERAATTADALAAAAVLAPDHPLEYLHPVLRAAVHDDMPAGQRALLHRRAATLLADDGAPVDAIALHLLHAERTGDPWVAEVLSAAAGQALAAGAVGTAGELFERALAEPPPPEHRWRLTADLGRARLRLGDVSGIALLEEALANAGDLDERATIAGDAATALHHAGRVDEALALLEGTIAAFPDPLDERRLMLTGHVVWLLGRRNDLQQRRPEVVRSLPRHLPGDTPAQRALLAVLADCFLDEVRPHEEVNDVLDRLRPLDGFVEELPLGSHLVAGAIGALYFCDRAPEGVELSRQAVARAEAQGALGPWIHHLCHLAGGLRRSGRLREAANWAAIARDRACELDPDGFLAAQTAHWHAFVLVELGDLEAAEAAAAAVGRYDDYGDFGGALALVRLRRGDLDGALAVPPRELATHPYDDPVLPEKIRAVVAAGRREEARAMADELLDHARRWGAPTPLGFALAAKGMAVGGAEGVALARDGVARMPADTYPLLRIGALLDLGLLLRRNREPAAARDVLRDAQALAQRIEAGYLEGLIADELRVAGARRLRRASTDPDALTASEERVVALAAEGRTNREIATALFVTHKTVEMHLGRAFRKLGVRSRRELGAALQARSPAGVAGSSASSL